MKKQIRNILIFTGIWLIIVVVGAAWYVEQGQKSDGFTKDNAFTYFSDHVYITDNAHGQGLLYMLSESGKVQSLFCTKGSLIEGFTLVDVDVYEEDLYTIYQRQVNDNGRLVVQYVVARQNEGMQITGLTPVFRLPMELNMQGMEVGEDRFYITALSDNGQQAYVYTLGRSTLVEIRGGASASDDRTRWESGKAAVAEYQIQESVRPRYMVQASYENGTLEVRYDNSAPEYFTPDPTAARLFNNRKLSVSQKMTVAGFDAALTVIIALAGAMLIVLLSVLMKERLRVVYAICALEILLAVALVGFFAVFLLLSRATSSREYLRYETAGVYNVFDGYGNVNMTDPGFYDTPEYETLSARIRRRVDVTGKDNPTQDLLVVDTYSGNVILSAGGRNLSSISEAYGEGVLSFVGPETPGEHKTVYNLSHQGRAYTLFRTNLLQSGYPDLVAISVTQDKNLFNDTLDRFGTYVQVLILLFLLCSLAGILLLLWQSSDIRHLKRALSTLARGDEIVKKPRVLGRDMNYLWNTIFEVQKNIQSINRVKFLTYEAYYRFAPKSIERILGKASITEVQVGEQVTGTGTLTYVTLPGLRPEQQSSMNLVSGLLQTLDEVRAEYDGILVSQDVSSSTLRILFLEENRDAVGFGTDLILKLKEEKKGAFHGACVVQQYTTYLYGVVGTSEEAEVYLSSAEGDYLASFAGWFATLSLGQVITKDLMEQMGHVGETRYIGFLLPDENHQEQKLELYEVLDAQIPGTRKRRSAMNSKFAEALSLFYEQDFYLARNLFTEILREAPDDGLTKWYLFECEHYLDVAAPEGFTGALHKER